jgi:hypothetical protein
MTTMAVFICDSCIACRRDEDREREQSPWPSYRILSSQAALRIVSGHAADQRLS